MTAGFGPRAIGSVSGLPGDCGPPAWRGLRTLPGSPGFGVPDGAQAATLMARTSAPAFGQPVRAGPSNVAGGGRLRMGPRNFP
jgi:hypothetical protein